MTIYRFKSAKQFESLSKIEIIYDQCRTVKSCFHHSFINRPQCRRICIAIYSVHWYSRGAESDDQTFEKHWINNWQTELNILYIFYQKRENSIFNIDFLTLKKHPISNLQPEFNIQVTSCKFCCVFDCNWRFLVAYFTLILFFQAVELPITQFSEDSYKKITSNLVQTPSCLWLHVHWDWRSLVGRFAPLPLPPSLMLFNFWICQLFHPLCVTSPTFCYRWKLQSVWICFQEFWKVSLCPGFKTFLPVHARFFGNINKGFPLSPSSGGDLRWLIKTAP